MPTADVEEPLEEEARDAVVAVAKASPVLVGVAAGEGPPPGDRVVPAHVAAAAPGGRSVAAACMISVGRVADSIVRLEVARRATFHHRGIDEAQRSRKLKSFSHAATTADGHRCGRPRPVGSIQTSLARANMMSVPVRYTWCHEMACNARIIARLLLHCHGHRCLAAVGEQF